MMIVWRRLGISLSLLLGFITLAEPEISGSGEETPTPTSVTTEEPLNVTVDGLVYAIIPNVTTIYLERNNLLPNVTEAIAESLDSYSERNLICCSVGEETPDATSPSTTDSTTDTTGSGSVETPTTEPDRRRRRRRFTVNVTKVADTAGGVTVTFRASHDKCDPTVISSGIVVDAITKGGNILTSIGLVITNVTAVGETTFLSCEPPLKSKCRLLPFGLDASDKKLPPTNDGCSEPILLSYGGFPFFGKRLHTVYVCANGLVSSQPFNVYIPRLFPGGSNMPPVDVIAPFWANVDVRSAGAVWYHLYTFRVSEKDDAVLNRTSAMLQAASNMSFNAIHSLVVTWENVSEHGSLGTKRNTFQLVMTTDGAVTLARAIYHDIQWAGSVRPATIGYVFYNDTTHVPITYHNFDVSGHPEIVDIDDIAYCNKVNLLGKPRPKHYDLAVRDCLRWHFNDSDEFPNLSWAPITEACPLAESQVRLDFNFYPVLLSPDRQTCYASLPQPTQGNLVLNVESECCYNSGGLAVDVGRATSSSPYSRLFDFDLYNTFTELPRKLCCDHANLCDLFRERRPPPTTRYSPPRWSWLFGDPHVRTMDNLQYTFNGVGEYTLIRTEKGTFVLQGRTRALAGGSNSTIFVAFAMGGFSEGVSSPTETGILHVGLKSNGSLLVLGKPGSGYSWIDLTAQFEAMDSRGVLIFNRTRIRKFGSGVLVASYVSGISVRVEASESLLTGVFAGGDDYKGETRGLLGVWNDDKSDDLTAKDGTEIPINATDRQIHFNFGQTWQIAEKDSIFYYEEETGPADYHDVDHTPLFADELRLDEVSDSVVLATCNDSLACRYDAVVTGDIALAGRTLRTDILNSEDNEQLSNMPPEVMGNNVIQAFVGDAFVYMLTAIDPDGDPVTVSLSGSPPPADDYKLDQGNDGRYTFTWTPKTTDPVSLQFVASDGRGATGLLQPRVLLCLCRLDLNATCDNAVRDDGDGFEVETCTCGAGWGGDNCDEDLDGCSFVGCFPGVACTDLPPPAIGATCGECPDGTRSFENSCVDIDECATGVSDCAQECTNKLYSFTCNCRDGYTLDLDGRSCNDINECNFATCHQKCTNAIGSFQCGCGEGFVLNADGINCDANEKCLSPQNCEQKCASIKGSDVCFCERGYTAVRNNCTDVDECADNTNNCEQLCNNTIGSFLCYCQPGFILNADGKSCDDIVECANILSSPCADFPGKVCHNSMSSFTCACPDGTYEDDDKCIVGKPPTLPPIRKTDGPREVNTGLSTAEIVGIAVGSAGGFIFIIAIIVVICILKKSRTGGRKVVPKPMQSVEMLNKTKTKTIIVSYHGSQSTEELITSTE